MGKNSNLKYLGRFIALAVSHKIGQLVEPTAVYNEKYKKEANNFMIQAGKIKLRENWNNNDKEEIRKEVKSETIKELNRKMHINKSKFDVFEEVIDNCLRELGLC